MTTITQYFEQAHFCVQSTEAVWFELEKSGAANDAERRLRA